MATITVQEEEYRKLKQQARAYQQLMAQFFESIPSASIDTIVKDFKSTGLYTNEFIADLESGLRKSSIA